MGVPSHGQGSQGSEGTMKNGRLPVPQAQAFVVCREVWHNPRTNEFMIAGPVSHVPVPQFPASIRLSVYAHFTGGHGTYNLADELRPSVSESLQFCTVATTAFPQPHRAGIVLLSGKPSQLKTCHHS